MARHRRRQPVADAGHGEHDLGVARVGLDLLAQPPDVDAHRLVVVELAVAAPDVLDELRAGEGLTGMLREEDEQPELGGGEVQSRPSRVTLARVRSMTRSST